MEINIILVGIIAAGVGGVIGALLRSKVGSSKIANAEKEAGEIVDRANRDADSIRKEADIEAKDTVLKAKTDWEDEVKEIRRDLQGQEKRLQQKEENLDRKGAQLDDRDSEMQRREQSLRDKESNLASKQKEADELVAEQRGKLETISGLSSEEAKKMLLDSMESEARHDAAKLIKQIEEEAQEVADKKAKNILALSIQRYAGDYVAEKSVSVVPLPNDEMKGRIIGREGRNIRAIEAATGIDLIIDDTPEAVILSGFNPAEVKNVIDDLFEPLAGEHGEVNILSGLLVEIVLLEKLKHAVNAV